MIYSKLLWAKNNNEKPFKPVDHVHIFKIAISTWAEEIKTSINKGQTKNDQFFLLVVMCMPMSISLFMSYTRFFSIIFCLW